MSDNNILEYDKDILAEVLARLPFLPLFRYERVSRLWRDVIHSPSFKEMHRRKICTPTPTVYDISKMGMVGIIGADEAKILLKPLIEPGNPYTNICLSKRIFNIEAAQVAAPILSSMKHQLEGLDLSEFVERPTMFEFVVSKKWSYSKARALEVFKLFSEALEGSLLKYLNLSNNALGEEGIRAFMNLLKSQTRLEEFRCSSNRLGRTGSTALVEALQVCTHLKRLDLSRNTFCLEAAIALSNSIFQFENLRQINLRDMILHDEGASAIVNALRISAPQLQVLELAGNRLTDQCASLIAVCIASKQHLVKLDLSMNSITDNGAVMISEALKDGHQEMKEIDIKRNCLTIVGARAIAQCVVNKPGFNLLSIVQNFRDREGIHEFYELERMFDHPHPPPCSFEDEDEDEENLWGWMNRA